MEGEGRDRMHERRKEGKRGGEGGVKGGGRLITSLPLGDGCPWVIPRTPKDGKKEGGKERREGDRKGMEGRQFRRGVEGGDRDGMQRKGRGKVREKVGRGGVKGGGRLITSLLLGDGRPSGEEWKEREGIGWREKGRGKAREKVGKRRGKRRGRLRHCFWGMRRHCMGIGLHNYLEGANLTPNLII